MRFNILAGLAFLASAVAANPILKPRQDFNTSQPFHLKTAGASNPEHNDLYVYGYHTGAGFNDAVLSSDSSIANKAILNNTRVQFLLGTDFPWGFTMGGATNYAAWEMVEIDTGYGTQGFYIDAGSLQWNVSGFGGWAVCDWWHNAPQLFWLVDFYHPQLPSSCSKVDLRAEYVES
ncbi:hypothetical protein M432DRAFT_417351 [Thermoascus aurantiacus ATCC 26904]